MCGIIRLLVCTDEIDTIRKVFQEVAPDVFRVVTHCAVISNLDDSEWDVDLIKTELFKKPAIAVEIKGTRDKCLCDFDAGLNLLVMEIAHRLAMLFEVA